MKRIINLFLCLILVNISIAQTETPTDAPLNPDYVKYLKDISLGKLITQTKDGYGLGEIPNTTTPNFDDYMKKNASKSKASFPAVYDLRSLGYLTSVKNQGSCGSCWSFTTLGSIESFWKKNGFGDNDLSEQNLITCHGFEWGPCDGGNTTLATAYLSRMSGPVTEAEVPYNIRDTGVCRTNYSPSTYVAEARYFPNDKNTIKQAIMDYGAIYSNMRWEDGSYRSSDKTYYYTGTGSTNHAVLLVGWDDNKATASSNPGAWIIKNSWGTGWGENGYFYISYDDSKINSSVAAWPLRFTKTTNDKLYYYDKLGYISSMGYGSNIGYGLVKFVASSTQKITKVATYAPAAGTVVDFEIYDTKEGNTLSNLLGSLTNQTCPLPGYYTFNLSSPITIASGNDFYIKVKYNTPSYNWPIPFETASGGYASPTIESNVCWASSTGSSWTLLGQGTSYQRDLCIRAYTVPGIPLTKLTTASCGASFSSIYNYIYCNAVSGAEDYQYYFADAGTNGFTNTITRSSLGSPTSTGIHLWGCGISPGRTYNVQVKAKVNGQWGDYGNVCQITIGGSIPKTKLTTASCGATFRSLNNLIYCNAVTGAVDYEYYFTIKGVDFSKTATRSSYGTGSLTYINLSWVSGLGYGVTYNIQVRAKIGDTWGEYGDVCEVTINGSVPKTKLSSMYCDKSFSSTYNYISCNAVKGAQDYQYYFQDMGTSGFTKTVTRSTFGYSTSNSIHLWGHGLVLGNIYSVQVRAKVGGVWGDYGDICYIELRDGKKSLFISENNLETELEMPEQYPVELDATVFPNPVNETATIQIISPSDANYNISIMDITGRIFITKDIPGNSTTFKFSAEELQNGLYFIKIVQENNIKLIKFIKE